MVLLQETKRSQIDEKFVRSCWYRDKLDFLAVDSVGTAGGLLCIVHMESRCFSNVGLLLQPELHHFVKYSLQF